MKDYYKSVKSPAQGIYTEKGSKFLSFIFPVSAEFEVKQHLEELRKEYYDAKHHVYAFILGPELNIFRASDDGEPPNSSGQPVLNQIRSYGLSNVLIVVVRYFGGTKLGIHGLINAYKSAAIDAISNAEIVEKYVLNRFSIIINYEDLNYILKILKDYNAQIIKQEFFEKCKIIFEIRLSLAHIVIEKIKLNNGIILF